MVLVPVPVQVPPRMPGPEGVDGVRRGES